MCLEDHATVRLRPPGVRAVTHRVGFNECSYPTILVSRLCDTQLDLRGLSTEGVLTREHRKRRRSGAPRVVRPMVRESSWPQPRRAEPGAALD